MAAVLQVVALLCCYVVEGAVVLTQGGGSHGLTQGGVGNLKLFESGKYKTRIV